MQKAFLEVFPGIPYTEDWKQLLSHVQVQFINLTKNRRSVHIYLICDRLIPKKEIFRLEALIEKHIFQEKKIQVRIIEKFQLSEQYTLENLLQVYRDSILLDLRAFSVLDYNLLRTADWDQPDDTHLTLTLEDGPVARSREAEILDRVSKILGERCGFHVELAMNYREPVEKERKEPATRRRAEENPEYLTASAEPLPWEEGADTTAARAVPSAASTSASQKKNAEKQPAAKAAEKKSDSGPESKKSFDGKKGGFRKRSGGSYDGGNFQKGYIRSSNPSVIYGRDFTEESIPISEIQEEMGEVVICGKVLSVETRELRNGEKSIITFSVTDYTDTIMCKIFLANEFVKEFTGNLKPGTFILLKGMTVIDRYDRELGISSVVGIRKTEDFTVKREDNAPVKRVELHCHTKMSEMDGVSEASDLVKQAAGWGHKALAITDHGVVYAFPAAEHAIPKDSNMKLIFGVEGYLVDDMKGIVTNSKNQSLDMPFVVFDLETTGLNSEKNKIIEIGAVRVEGGEVTDRFSTMINPHEPIPFHIEKVTNINDEMVINAPDIEEMLPKFLDFAKGAVFVAHNADFDMSFIQYQAKRLGLPLPTNTYVDTVALARVLLPKLSRYKLDTVAKELGVSLENHHRAVEDAEATAQIYLKLQKMLADRDIHTLDEVEEISHLDADAIKKLPTYHIILLAKNETGRINLYRLVSESHVDYFFRRPRIPRSLILANREGILIGSACEAGELFRGLLRGEPEAEIARMINFYDYLEIQPLGNNQFMLDDPESDVKTVEDLQNLNRRICELGEQFHKPVVATCDVHFMNPEDEIYRRIIMAGMGFKDADHQAPLYLRTTEEMLAEFQYLGPEKAEEVVITNTNLIADCIEKIAPVRPDKCPPVIENSDVDLRNMCYEKAKSMYGDPLPEIVKDRLERELHSIISNGYAVMYIIAQKLVWKSNEDGYLVGSRGSVGSSFVATMSGITEVNPLSPHYYCKKCHYNDFYSDDVKAFAGGAGCDMPDKICPVCGEKLTKDGFDIPFETFLGFKGDKEPDIDLNFSGEYQSHAHAYTEVIFGKGHTFRAGTISGLADKTAFGYVKKYYEERGQSKRNCEIDRIVQGCVGIRRSSGQHPGGIIVMPHGEEIYSFTPVQHPANDMTTKTITTHFDYHSIDHNLLKLDILGHDDPTMIKMLGDLTKINMQEIPLDSPEVMSLFMNTTALGVEPKDIYGCRLGALGIPEFGTDFAMQMLIDAKPTKFSDLVRIAGLAHGTDVWLGNAQTLIKEGTATIETAICTRDDIMLYLIQMGVDAALSFTIMESVRKGKGLKPEWEAEMRAHDVPDWYIGSCKKIKYMFPKAHAAAYVMMAWRIAYCKIFYPLAYYCAFFSIRAVGFSYELMCLGKAKLERHMDDYRSRMDSLSKAEQDTYRDMRIVQEMYARGYEFWPIDVYKAKGVRFQVIDGKIMPSFNSIAGLGEKAAIALEEAAAQGPFLSLDDLRARSKLSKTVVDKMVELGILKGLPESNQLSLFDFVSGD